MLDFSMLIVDTNRSKAYLQNLLRNNFYPKEVIVLQERLNTLPEQKSYHRFDSKTSSQILIRRIQGVDEYFDEKEQIVTTLKKNGINHKIINTIDINSDEVVNSVKESATEHMVYSGPGGFILRKEILQTGKKFIHVHSGWLPEYKGSTTIYYSMLIDKNISCSVIFLNEEIDAGEILYRKSFDIGEDCMDFDLVFDPIARASTLIDFMRKSTEAGKWDKGAVQSEGGNTFYIIHPVLKHLSILKQTGMRKILPK